jgi:dihydrolipoamide dehydrogenase
VSDTYDIVVLGGGPGGYATALRAVGHGLRVAVIEADRVGGTCLHRGCIPSKALLHVAHLADTVPQLVELGLATAGPEVDVDAAGRFRDRVVDQLHRGLSGLLASRSITVVEGWGRVVGPGEAAVTGADGDTTTLRAAHLVIATGSAPIDLPHVTPDGNRILRSDEALRLERIPQSVVVVGGGSIGVEFASLWRSLGSEVTVLEVADQLLPLEDPDSSKALTRAFSQRGIKVRVSTSLTGARCSDAGVVVETSDGSTITADQMLVAVGRRPATARMGLEELGVLSERGHVIADAFGSTSVDGLWAVGDVLPTLALAHAAFAEGFVVADVIAGLDPNPVEHHLVPRVTYCTPEVASVGLTEPQARDTHGDQIIVTTVPLAGNARALIEGGGGLVKLVCAADGTLLGGHVVGPSATELIGELGLATSWEALAAEVGDVVHAHPTLTEGIREAALAAAGSPFHLHP